MKLVVDANVLFSFFKKGSAVKELILDPDLEYNLGLFAPELVLEEVGRHCDEICSKFSVKQEDFKVMLSSLELFIKIVEKESFKESIPAAQGILKDNIKDVPYAALALWLRERGTRVSIWSNDKGLKPMQEHGIKVYDIKKLLDHLKISEEKEP
jgi:predicted nucleic acid-binding protein